MVSTPIDIISIGQLNADIVVSPVDRFPEDGTADGVELLEIKCGGCALNTGLVLQKLGVSTGLVGRISNDTFGNFLLNELNQRQINTEGINIDRNTPTSSVIVLISSVGERSLLYCPGGNEKFTLENIDFDLIAKAQIVHMGGIMKLHKLNAAEVLKKTKRLGLLTSIDTDWDTTGRWLPLIEDCLEHTDIMFAGIEEARQISQKQMARDICKFFLNRGVKTVVLKMGIKGCHIKTTGEELILPAFKLQNVVDTTGAGDAFVAGFLAGYHKGWNLEKASKLANACGALCTTKVGTTEGITTLDMTINFMENTSVFSPGEGRSN